MQTACEAPPHKPASVCERATVTRFAPTHSLYLLRISSIIPVPRINVDSTPKSWMRVPASSLLCKRKQHWRPCGKLDARTAKKLLLNEGICQLISSLHNRRAQASKPLNSSMATQIRFRPVPWIDLPETSWIEFKWALRCTSYPPKNAHHVCQACTAV